MQTFSLLHYEKPSKEKKITGYCSIAKLNKPNPAYTSPELGGSNDDSVNTKSLLMSDPKEIRQYLRHFRQGIYNEQDGLNTSKEHLLAYLSEDSEEFIEDLNRKNSLMRKGTAWRASSLRKR